MRHSLSKLLLFTALALVATPSFSQNTTACAPCALSGGGCDTVGVEHKVSPWQVGGFLGPAVAYCGSWAGTFGINNTSPRDQTLFNGVGIAAQFNADRFFKGKSKKIMLGLGVTAGAQRFFNASGYKEFLLKKVDQAGFSRTNAVLRNAPSEDFFLAVGPVLKWKFKDKPKSAFLEAAIKGGIFRTDPSNLAAYSGTTRQLAYAVTPTDRRYHPGFIGSVGVFFPTKSLWTIGLQAGGFYSLVDYYIVSPDPKLFDFTRKHGGFNIGFAARRTFEYDRPVKKAPTPALSAEAPALNLKMGSLTLAGNNLDVYSGTNANGCEPIKISWASRNANPSNETFTARIHRIFEGKDEVIAQQVCQTATELTWPKSALDTKGCPLPGSYYVTVHSQQSSSCTAAMSEVTSAAFSVKGRPDTVTVEKIVNVPVPAVVRQECKVVYYTYKRGKEKSYTKYKKGAGDCADCLCPVTVEGSSWVRVKLGEDYLTDCPDGYLPSAVPSNVRIPSWGRSVSVEVERTVKADAYLPIKERKVYRGTVDSAGTLRLRR